MNLFENYFTTEKLAEMLFRVVPEAEIKQKIANYTPEVLALLNKWLKENVPLKEELEEIKHSLLLFDDNNTMMAQLVTLDKNWNISRIILTKDVKEFILSLELEKTIINISTNK
jgi:hypothetical protein